MKAGEQYDSGETLGAGGIDIAVIGVGCRFPGARNAEEFWENLRAGVESISLFTDEELLAAGVRPEELRRPDYVKASAVLRDVDQFDASFFGLSPRDAELLDPQQRLFMECAWEALESAGYQPDNCGASVGVYAGVGINTYLLNNILANPELAETLNPYQFVILNDKDFLATRLSYKLNLKGPSVVVQTACSTSLVAVHCACRALLGYECDMALAGGVTIRIPEVKGYVYQEGGVASPDGHCRAFDAKAQGTIGGNGAGVVILKRLEDALADGDQILAVIKGSAINNDGAAKVGFTAPSVDGQAQVISEAQSLAGVEPETITYVEAHGTGTALGDPIEMTALTQAFRVGTEKRNFCAVGSVKTNVGHLDAAAGVAGLIKTVMALRHRTLPPSLHFETPNPMIDFAASPFYVNSTARAWKTDGVPRRAGVSSFGMGGTNAHVIVEEAQEASSTGGSRPWQLVALSTRSDASLDTASANLSAHFGRAGEFNLADAAYTLHVGRKAFEHRRVTVCRDAREAAAHLASNEPPQVLTGAVGEESPEVVFLFPGQGSQYVGMGRELYEHEPLFRTEVDRCAELLASELAFDLREVLYPEDAGREEAEQRIGQTFVTQVALFVVEYATARLWMSWGVRPQAMVGHSIGEYVAACLAGVMSLEDALRLVALRGRLMQEMEPGPMLAVSLGEEELRPLLSDGLSLAAVNGPASCVVSGAVAHVEELIGRLLVRGVRCRRLQTSHAFHSEMMQPAAGRFAAALKSVSLSQPRLPYLSNLTGTWIEADEATAPDYWVKHLLQTVRFSENVRELLKRPTTQLMLEVGPGRTLATLARQHFVEPDECTVLASMRHPQQEESDVKLMLTALGRLWLAGVEVSWRDFYAAESRRRVALPTYPFERRRYWIDAPRKSDAPRARATQLLRNPNIEQWLFAPVWKQSLPPAPVAATSGNWLLFLDDCGLGEAAARLLSEMSREAVTVRKGGRFRRLNATSYEIDPRRREDYDALLGELQARGQFPQGITHLWSVTANDSQASAAEAFDEMQEAGFDSVLNLSQSLAALKLNEPLRLCVVTNEMQLVTGTESSRPEKATLLGLCKVIGQELPFVNCRSVDVILPTSGARQDRLSELLVKELLAVTNETTVAYRGARRWVQVFESLPAEAGEAGGVRVREGGVYLITGGLGNVGLLLAEYVAGVRGTKLVLVSRTGLPAREEWESLLSTRAAGDEEMRKVRAVLALEASGAEVMIAAADVAERRQMCAVLDEVRARFGRLDGVIYAAGLVGEAWVKPILETSRELVEAHFRPKVRGLLLLDKLLREFDFNPDFCLLVSSLSSILGGIGYAAYASANAFMDALANSRVVKDGLPWMSVNWDGWQAQDRPETEGEAGAMSTTQLGIISREGVRAFARLLPLAGIAPQLAVSTADLNARLEKLAARQQARPVAASEAGGEEAAAASHPRTGLHGVYVEPAGELERIIAEVWQDAFGIRQVGARDSFFELGGDSLLATQILPRLRESLQVELTLRNFFEAPTVASLASLVTEMRREQEAEHGAEHEAEDEAEIMRMLELLSDEELEAELNKRIQITE
jgi:acyl transferase domain-containing protein